MPVPWRQSSTPFLIEDVSDRGITIQQLLDLKVFIQSLCKTGLFRNTSEFSRSNGTYGQRIDWSSLNMYHIADEIIKKAIPYLDPDGRDRFPPRLWYSWIEFISERAQRPMIMMSHSWSGRFRDFMEVIETLHAEKRLSMHFSIWVCTFANCQFGEDFGSSLVHCPFLKALRKVDLIVMVIDRAGDSLTRSWCGLEVCSALKADKDLELYTSVGRVGSSKVCSGPLVDAVAAWDIRRTEAAEPSYRRQILNFVAGQDEHLGLKADDAGELIVEGGRPQLQESEVDPDHPRRMGGRDEYLYEAKLFKTHGEKFNALNMDVRLEVMAKIGRARRPKGCAADHTHRGISLGSVRAFARRVRAECESWQPPQKWEDLSVADINRLVVMPAVAERQCSYAELVSHTPLCPQVAMSYTWNDPFHELVSSIEWLAEALQMSDFTPLWLRLFAKDSKTEAEGTPLLPIAIRECEALAFCASSEPERMSRKWRLLQIEIATRLGKSLFLATPHGALACVKPFPGGAVVFGDIDPGIARVFGRLRMEDAKCEYREDEEVIAKSFEEGASSEKERRERYHRSSARLRRYSAGVIIRAAAAAGDVTELADICRTAGLSLNRDSMRGALGESGVHVAASAGSLEALRVLLDLGMDCECCDAVAEQPLHYAAMAGNAAAVRLLLDSRACPLCENIYGETALEVARLSPAAFLGVSTAEVEAELSAASVEASGGAVAGSGLAAVRHVVPKGDL